MPEPNTGCWLWAGASIRGYGQMRINGRSSYVHRISYELFRGLVPAGMEVCHTCDVPCCVNPDHLFLGTHDINMKDCASKGRIKSPDNRGEKQGASKLVVADVVAIRAADGSLADIAKQFAISPITVYDIKHRKTWTHV